MKRLILFWLIACGFPIAAQQNWAAIPCSKMKRSASVDLLFTDSLHNELIIGSISGSTICNTTYKGIVAYNGSTFRNLDKGLNLHEPNAAGNGALALDCTTYGDKTLYGGIFFSVGSNTLFTKSIALWDGSTWSAFPTPVFNNTANWSSFGAIFGFLKHNGNLWVYGAFDTIGGTVSKNIATYNGTTFITVPTIPVDAQSEIIKMVAYKNKIIATGNFQTSQSPYMWRLAQFDGISWAPVGVGVQGGIGSVWDMVEYKDTLYIAGSWSQAAGNVSNYIMKWDGTQLHDAGFGNFCGWGAIRKLVPFKNRLYAFGNFDCAANQRAFGIAYYENGMWTVPQDSVGNNNIRTATVYNGSIYIGGNFLSINGDTTIQKLAKLICPDFDAASGCLSDIKENFHKIGIKVFPNPSTNKINIEFEPGVGIDRLSISNTLGQEIYGPLKPENTLAIDVSLLSPGIYFLKAENSESQEVVKVVKE